MKLKKKKRTKINKEALESMTSTQLAQLVTAPDCLVKSHRSKPWPEDNPGSSNKW